jgi:hypothetical protein
MEEMENSRVAKRHKKNQSHVMFCEAWFPHYPFISGTHGSPLSATSQSLCHKEEGKNSIPSTAGKMEVQETI